MEKFFLTQIKHKIKGYEEIWDKGVVIKNTYDEVQQSFHAYLGAYAYGHEQGTDYVYCEINDINGTRLDWKRWGDPKKPEPEPEPEEDKNNNEEINTEEKQEEDK